jgi:hypothetical protein
MPKTLKYPEDEKGIQYNSAFDDTHEGARAKSREVQEAQDDANAERQFNATVLGTPPAGATHYLTDEEGIQYNPKIGGHGEYWQLYEEAREADAVAISARSKLAAVIESTPEPLVLNEEFILQTLKDVFGNELKLSEKELDLLTADFEKNWKTFFVSGVWPNFESALERTEEVRNIRDINKRRKYIQDKADEVMKALAA